MENKIGKLVIVRHEESEWNKRNLFTGKEDVHLTAHGFKMAEAIGKLIKDIHINKIYTSAQVRAMETEICMMNSMGQYCPSITHTDSLNERDYGIYTGINKKEKEKEIGKEEYDKLRRSWDYPIPEGETLKMVYERVVPFFKMAILPILNQGKNVLIVSHGNTIRALLKYIENISDKEIENVEMLFDEILVYRLDEAGHIKEKEIKKLHYMNLGKEDLTIQSSVRIIATIGPASEKTEVLNEMIKSGMYMARLNFYWGDLEEKKRHIQNIKKVSKENKKEVLILMDLPGPRIQEESVHTYDINTKSAITEEDRKFIKFGVENEVDYIGVSFVANKEDIIECRKEIQKWNGKQKVIAKIEREEALRNIDEIIRETDAVMIARGDLGNEVPLEKIPFIQADLIKKCKQANKPVITATQMLYSMKDNPKPTRAEVTDVINAVLEGTDAVMLSEETSVGRYPIQTVYTMKHLVLEAEGHLQNPKFNEF